MKFTREQKQDAYKNLSPEIQDFVMLNETTEIIGNFLNTTSLNTEQSDVAYGELLCAMLNLQSLQEAMFSIAKLDNKNNGDFNELKENLEKNIFSKITEIQQKNIVESTSFRNEIETEQKNNEEENLNEELASFDEEMRNQIKAMRPARLASESVAGRPAREAASENLPIGEEKRGVIHNYIGSDPYREPLK